MLWSFFILNIIQIIGDNIKNNIKYSQNVVEEKFKEYGLILKDVYINMSTPLYCFDDYGYEYKKSFSSVLENYKNHIVNPRNPYSINNIHKYLSINGLTLKLLEEEYINSNTKMKFQCECGSIFKTTWNVVVTKKKYYCNFCSKSKRFDNICDYTSEINDYCNLKNYTLINESVTRCTHTFSYICNKHKDEGIQYSTYYSMVKRGRGCKYCGIESRGILHRLEESCLKEAVERVGFVYVGNSYIHNEDKKVTIHYICPKHKDKGVQFIKYNNLLVSNGRCRYCRGMDRTKEDLQFELDALHNLITILEYKDYKSPILVKCKVCGYEWRTRGISLTQVHNCPRCPAYNFELQIANILDNWNYEYQTECWFDDCRDILPLPFDFFLTNFNLIIEADGENHYKPIRRGSCSEEDAFKIYLKLKKHDDIKTKYCIKNNISLIRIPYWERDDLEYYLWNKLVKYNVIEEIAV